MLEPPATRPPVDARLWRLIAACGLAFAVLRLTIMLALLNAGPAIVAALTPLTPVITLAFGLLAGTDQLDWRSRAGATQLGGMLLCTLSAGLLVPLRGPLLVGRVPVGDFAPSNAGLGVLFMLINCSTSSFTQLVNKRILSPPPGEGGGAVRAGALPLFSATAYVAGAATACLFPMALVLAPSPGQWVPTGWMVVRAERSRENDDWGIICLTLTLVFSL